MSQQHRDYSPESVAEYMGVSRSTVYQWMREGKLVGEKVGTRWRFTQDGLVKLMRALGREPAAPRSTT